MRFLTFPWIFLAVVLMTFLSPISSQATNSLSSLESNTCHCDVNPNFCDYQCCCDTSCSTTLRQNWRSSGQCLDQEFVYSTSSLYPCSYKRPKTLEDLRAGLRIYYQILKIFFCVAFDNSDDKDRFTSYKSSDQIAEAVAISTSSSATKTTSSYVQTSAGNLEVSRPSFGSSLCSDSSVPFDDNLKSRDCYFRYVNAPAITTCPAEFDLSSFSETFVGLGGAAITPTIRYYRNNLVGLDLQNLTAAPTATCSGCDWTDFLSEIHYQIQLDTTNNISAVSIDMIFIREQDVCGPAAPIAVVKRTTSLYFVNELSNGMVLKGPAFRFGDPVPIHRATGSAYQTYSPNFNFLFLDSNGDCVANTIAHNPNVQSYLEFGYNTIFTCRTPSASITLKAHTNINSNFAYAAVFPNANYTYSNDWATVSKLSPASGDVSISIYYSAIGRDRDPGYRINSVSQTNLDADDSSERRIYINFLPIPQTAEFFVAPNPTARVSMPDNVLTPFVTYKDIRGN